LDDLLDEGETSRRFQQMLPPTLVSLATYHGQVAVKIGSAKGLLRGSLELAAPAGSDQTIGAARPLSNHRAKVS